MIQLWHTMPSDERKRYMRLFLSLTEESLSSLTSDEITLLVQWIFRCEDYTIDQVVSRSDGVDMLMRHPRHGGVEYLRLYSDGRLRANTVFDLLESAQGKDYSKLRLFQLHKFTESQLRTQRDYPVVLEFVDRDGLLSRIHDVQRQYSFWLAAKKKREARPVPTKHRVGHKRKTPRAKLPLRIQLLIALELFVAVAIVLFWLWSGWHS